MNDNDLVDAFRLDIGTLHVLGKTTPDKSKLFLSVADASASSGRAMTVEEKEQQFARNIKVETFLKHLSRHMDVERVNLNVISDIVRMVNSGSPVIGRRISKGEEPVPGRDGRMVLSKKVYTTDKTFDFTTGMSALAELYTFDFVSEGDILARIYPPQPGENGHDALGHVVPYPEGNKAVPEFDQTIELDPHPIGKSYEVLIAAADGYPIQEGDKLRIVETLQIKGDLKGSDGLIDFTGTVKLKGNISSGFKLKAKNGIRIKGTVDDARLESSNGGIDIDGKVSGGDDSLITCEQSFRAGIVHAVKVEVKGDIIVTKEARDAILSADSSIYMPKGSLIGGHAYCACGAEFLNVGSESQERTVVELSGDLEAKASYSDLKLKADKHIKALEMLKLHLGRFADNQSEVDTLQGEFKNKIEEQLTRFNKLQKNLKILESKIERAREQTVSSVNQGVNVIEAMYPGVEIHAKGMVFHCKEKMQGPFSIQFNSAEKKFVKGKYEPLSCTFKG